MWIVRCRCCCACMFEKRLRTYRAIGYARGEAPLGLAEVHHELTVEYNDEALCHFDEAE